MASLSSREGSLWRRWDLHLHCPGTVLNDQFNDDWDGYLKAIREQPDVAVLGITDYGTTRGFDSFMEKWAATSAEHVKLVIPNIELRVELQGHDGESVNVHLLVDSIAEGYPEKLNLAMNLLSVHSRGQDYPCTRSGIVSFGRSLHRDADLTDDVAFEKGYLQFKLPIAALKRFRENSWVQMHVLIGVDGRDASNVDKRDGYNDRWKELVGISDFFFCPNDDFVKKWSTEDDKTAGGLLGSRPCFHGSDAHELARVLKPNHLRYCWIKADPTFEGLKQTLIEPSNRVFIGEEPPEMRAVRLRTSKTMKSIGIHPKDNIGDRPKWFDWMLPLNPGLVAVIGKKGSGKSALADVIAWAAGYKPNESKEFSFLRADRFWSADGQPSTYHHATVNWVIGESQERDLARDSKQSVASPLVKYLPQAYFETLCGRDGEAVFQQMINEVVFRHIPDSERFGKDSLDELVRLRHEELQREVDDLVNGIRQCGAKIADLTTQLLPERVNALRQKLNQRKLELEAVYEEKRKEEAATEESQVNGSDDRPEGADGGLLGQLNAAQSVLKSVEDEIGLLEQQSQAAQIEIDGLKRLKARVLSFQKSTQSEIESICVAAEEFGLDLKPSITLDVSTKEIDVLIEAAETQLANLTSTLKDESEEGLRARLRDSKGRILSLSSQLDATQQHHATQLRKRVEREQLAVKLLGTPTTRDTVLGLSEELKKIKHELPETRKALIKARVDLVLGLLKAKRAMLNAKIGYYHHAISYLGTQRSSLEAIEGFNISASFAVDGFVERVGSMINFTTTGGFGRGVEESKKKLADLVAGVDWTKEEHLRTFLEKFLAGFAPENDLNAQQDAKKRVRTGFSPQDVYDYVHCLEFLIPWAELTWHDKPMKSLSPGERGAVLLLFFLVLDKDDQPLILDQPEENLDNESVYELLRPCIMHAKGRRQVILVTHNPNLAVACDAEQVVHATHSPSKQPRFKYFSGSLENPRIRQAAVEVLEGTAPAFRHRGRKYRIESNK